MDGTNHAKNTIMRIANAKSTDATPKSPQFQGNSRNNILMPKVGLKENNTYYWRVDAVARNGKLTRGEVWSFAIQTTSGRQIK